MDFAVARRNMVESQLRTNKVVDPDLLNALRTIPREAFLPARLRAQAYLDEHIQLSADRWMTPPMPIARLIQEAMPGQGDNALVIGEPTGYAAAVLGALCQSVFALDQDADVVSAMGAALAGQACDNVVPIEAPLEEGLPGEGPYDVILLGGRVEFVPDTLKDQLSEGGRLMAIVGGENEVASATLFGKRNGVVSSRILFDASVKPLPGFRREKSFSL
ncbi:MAG: protein-L-isoaspartate O-methyltransferase [Alphaproteobacteria bacterium]